MAAPPPSALSIACRSIANFVKQGLSQNGNDVQVSIGTPADAAPQPGAADQKVNLFFYGIEPSGFYPDRTRLDPWLIRLNCLITAFGVMEDSTSAGEIDLRMLGEVMRLFHETPVLGPIDVQTDVNGQAITETVTLQVVLQPIDLEAINHIWSTQGDIAYRPSVAYQLALAPIVPKAAKEPEGIVGALGLEVRSDMDAAIDLKKVKRSPPPVLARTVNTTREDWAPAICFVRDGGCEQSLLFEAGSPALAAFTPQVWIAGKLGKKVVLKWETWGDRGWEQAGGPTDPIDIVTNSIDPEEIMTDSIDPGEAFKASITGVALPDNGAGQWTLHAERMFKRKADEAEITVRSNPLLITVYPPDDQG